MSVPSSYSRTQIMLHWGIAILILVQMVSKFAIGPAWDAIEKGQEITGITPILHVIPGISVLLLVIVRLILRFRHGVPEAVEGGSPLQEKAAKAAHIALYVLLLLIPVSGLAAWFGGVLQAADAHGLFFKALLALILLHALAAIYHQHVLKDGLMTRMMKSK